MVEGIENYRYKHQFDKSIQNDHRGGAIGKRVRLALSL